MELKKVCAWCGDGQAQVEPGNKVTHGICAPCAEAIETVGDLPADERARIVAASLNFSPKIDLWDEVPKRKG